MRTCVGTMKSSPRPAERVAIGSDLVGAKTTKSELTVCKNFLSPVSFRLLDWKGDQPGSLAFKAPDLRSLPLDPLLLPLNGVLQLLYLA